MYSIKNKGITLEENTQVEENTQETNTEYNSNFVFSNRLDTSLFSGDKILEIDNYTEMELSFFVGNDGDLVYDKTNFCVRVFDSLAKQKGLDGIPLDKRVIKNNTKLLNARWVYLGEKQHDLRHLYSIPYKNPDIKSDSRVFLSVAYGNGIYIAAAYRGLKNRIIKSIDGGKTWKEIPLNNNRNWTSIVYGDGVWIAISNSIVGDYIDEDYMYDKINEKAKQINEKAKQFSINNNFKEKVNKISKIIRSEDDGETWEEIYGFEDYGWNCLEYGGGVWIAAASSGINERIIRSEDKGKTWEFVNLNSCINNKIKWEKIAYGNGVWMAAIKDNSKSQYFEPNKFDKLEPDKLDKPDKLDTKNKKSNKKENFTMDGYPIGKGNTKYKIIASFDNGKTWDIPYTKLPIKNFYDYTWSHVTHGKDIETGESVWVIASDYTLEPHLKELSNINKSQNNQYKKVESYMLRSVDNGKTWEPTQINFNPISTNEKINYFLNNQTVNNTVIDNTVIDNNNEFKNTKFNPMLNPILNNGWLGIFYCDGIWIAIPYSLEHKYIFKSTDGAKTWKPLLLLYNNQNTNNKNHSKNYSNYNSIGNDLVKNLNFFNTFSFLSLVLHNTKDLSTKEDAVRLFGFFDIDNSSNIILVSDDLKLADKFLVFHRITEFDDTDIISLDYGDDTWVAVTSIASNKNILFRSSDDGISWHEILLPDNRKMDDNNTDEYFGRNWKAVAYGNNTWIAVSYNGTGISDRIIRSKDNGLTWNPIPGITKKKWSCIAYGNDVWIAVSDDENSSLIIRSEDDGLSWKDIGQLNKNNIPLFSFGWRSVVYHDGIWVALTSYRHKNQIIVSKDNGITWNFLKENPQQNIKWSRILAGGGLWVALGHRVTSSKKLVKIFNPNNTWDNIGDNIG